MSFDPVAAAGLVAREVKTSERGGAATRVVVARRTYRTDQTDLWDAVTNLERLPRWFLPVSGDLQLGGRYQCEGNAGGVVERCDEPEQFTVTWEFGGDVSWLSVKLTPAPGGTTLELAHEAVVDADFWTQFGPGAAGIGWDLGLLGLGLHLEGGAPIDPREADTWATTPAGIQFVRTAAGGWAAAAITDGDESGPAHEAAERTVTFYTVEPEGAPED